MKIDRPIRLALFTDSFIHGGTERQFVQTLRALDPAHFQITVCCLKKTGPFLEDVQAMGFPILDFPVRSLYGPDTLRQQLRLFRMLRAERIQILHAFDFYSNIFALPVARAAGVPVTLASRREIAGDRSRAQRFAIRLACSVASGVVANSQAAGSVLTGVFGESPRKVAVIPNAIDLDAFRPARPREQVRSELKLAEDSILIGTVAALRPEKQLDLFVRAAAVAHRSMPNLRFVIVGEGTERRRLESFISDARLQSCVHLLGDRDDVPDWIDAFDAFVLSSQTESFPNAILEAMALGKPVVATRVGGTPEVVEDGATGFLVPNGKPEALAMSMIQLARDSSLRTRMGNAARARVHGNYTLAKLGARLSEVYTARLRERTAGRRLLQIGNYPPPVCGWGIHTQILDRELKKAGVDARVMDIGPGRAIKGRDCIPVRGALDYSWKLLKHRLRGSTFHVHVNGDSWKGYALAASAIFLGRLTGKPSALTFHAGPSQMYFPRRSGFWHWAFRGLFQSCGVIICNHEPVKKLLCDVYRVAENRVFAIPALSTQYEEEIPVPLAPAVEDFLGKYSPRLFSYSLFRPEFAMESLFEAFREILKRHPNAGLLIAGPKETPSHAVEQMRKLQVESNIMIPGNMAHAEFLTAVQRSDVFIRTHLRDGVCTSVLEALQLGVPVVASEDGLRPPSVVTYAPADAGDLAAKTLTLLADLEAARRAVLRPVLRDHLAEEIRVLMSLLDSLPPPRFHEAGE